MNHRVGLRADPPIMHPSNYDPFLRSTHATAMPSATAPTLPVVARRVTWSETAYEWLERSMRKRAFDEIPRNPSSAAWSFIRPTLSGGHSGGTGINFFDAALRRRGSITTNNTPPMYNYSNNGTTFDAAATTTTTDNQQLPVVDLRGNCGKTWTVISLACRFAVFTRPSQFDDTNDETMMHDDDNDFDEAALVPASSLPQVIIFDSTHGVTTSKLAHVLRSALLRHMNHDNIPCKATFEKAVANDMASCLSRIHIATPHNTTDCVAILEALRSKLSPVTDHPTLVLWDGFLVGPAWKNEANRMEVIRQVARLLQECQVIFISTTPSSSADYYRRREWEKFITHRIRLNRETKHQYTASGGGGPSWQHEYYATVHGQRFQFDITLSGVLS